MNPRVEDVHSIEAQAFQVCNTDGEEGLTWLEVEACEVLNHLFIDYVISKALLEIRKKPNYLCTIFVLLIFTDRF